jgi:hypothetical protein
MGCARSSCDPVFLARLAPQDDDDSGGVHQLDSAEVKHEVGVIDGSS